MTLPHSSERESKSEDEIENEDMGESGNDAFERKYCAEVSVNRKNISKRNANF
jgi:hypothetical protein